MATYIYEAATGTSQCESAELAALVEKHPDLFQSVMTRKQYCDAIDQLNSRNPTVPIWSQHRGPKGELLVEHVPNPDYIARTVSNGPQL